jgi:hypothetical protein
LAAAPGGGAGSGASGTAAGVAAIPEQHSSAMGSKRSSARSRRLNGERSSGVRHMVVVLPR